jgi:hypothetical protein
VALHWDWVCARLTARQLAALRHYTHRQLAIINQLPHPAWPRRSGRQPTLDGRVVGLMSHGPAGGRLAVEVVEMTNQQVPVAEQELREQAIQRLKKRSDFGVHLLVYLLVNGFLVAIWAFAGAGFFWPVFPLFGWGIGLVFNAWDVYWRKPLSEDRIRREMARMT